MTKCKKSEYYENKLTFNDSKAFGAKIKGLGGKKRHKQNNVNIKDWYDTLKNKNSTVLGIIIPLHKQGSLNGTNNYRGVVLSSIFNIIYTYIFTKRLVFGLRKLMKLRQVLEKSTLHLIVYLCYSQ